MQHTKRIAAGAAAVLTAIMLMVPASAHGGHHRTVQVQAQPVVTACGVCTVENCQNTGRHTHQGVTYCGYHHADGICNGDCAALCTVENCTVAGRHVHNGVTYCGSDHECGFCDGSCTAVVSVQPAASAAPAVSVSSHYSGHHGHHGCH